jgi:hypothetical protein
MLEGTAPAGEATGVAAPEGPAPGTEVKPGVFAPIHKTAGPKPTPAPPMFKDAAPAPATEEPPPASAEGAPAGDQPPAEGELPPEGADGAEGEGGEGEGTGEADPALVVELPGARPEEDPVSIEVSDPVVAERMRQLVKGYARREQAERIREQALQLREEAEQLNYAVQLDPAGVVSETLQSAADQAHLARFLLTRPGVLEKVQDFVAQLMDNPDAAPQLAALAEAERIRRKEHVSGEVRARQEVDRNARTLVRTIERSIESLSPDSLSEEAQQTLYNDVLGDLQRYAREHNLRLVDPRLVPGMVQRRFAVYGVAPKTKNAPGTPNAPAAPAPTAATAPSPTPGKPQKTGAQFTAARAARRAAAAAPPGVGAPVTTGVQKPPSYDPSQPGTPIQQAAAWARRNLQLRRQGPQ